MNEKRDAIAILEELAEANSFEEERNDGGNIIFSESTSPFLTLICC